MVLKCVEVLRLPINQFIRLISERERASWAGCPEKPNLKSAKTVKPYVASAWIWGGLADVMV
jgi:hypothetical protein